MVSGRFHSETKGAGQATRGQHQSKVLVTYFPASSKHLTKPIN
ncbi:hypothetical protein HMPREF1978_01906 [Actinomyces graevenitzii F0530]|uniref:Uncharacterized protein n=1 Tax=Actinomyces graevenitzii F0530 TaxID=1321817 RepID=U1PBQ5_9ACTO|nr:hypothetical protein HMPREF1978_01906 [Actinomyces graevenitzii F0530]